MLAELVIQDFAIIDQVTLQFDSGFTVLTGETGAGKSIMIDAISLLLGGRAQTESVRAGAQQARIEGVFMLDECTATMVRPLLDERGLLDEGDDLYTLILSREIKANGRNLCRVNGRPVSLKVLESIGEPLVDIHGQTEHLSLLKPAKHIDLLDRYAGTGPQRAQLAERVTALTKVRRQMKSLAKSERELTQRQDRLEYIVNEIEQARLKPGEEEALNHERKVLANAEKLSMLSGTAYTQLYEGADGQPAIVDVLSEVVKMLGQLERLDETIAESRGMAEQALYLLDDVARTVGSYRDEIEFNPERLQMIEQRLDLLFKLKRKYGDSIDAILEEASRAQAELEEIATAEERLRELTAIEEKLLRQIGELGLELSAARRDAALRLASAVERELGELRMERAKFETRVVWTPDAEGAIVPDVLAPGLDPNARYAFDATGLDRVEFMLAANPGEPAKPLAKVASGGETSRIMLALKTVLGEVDETPTLIFDEIDAGIGGRVGTIVGGKLRGLTHKHQVLCITHLPQIAAYGDSHLHIHKELINDRTVTRVECLDDNGRVDELTAMIGGGETVRETAIEMLNATRMVELG
ncbi:MAG: DNA repair protein RecN [Ardenticatenaceae bacterium]|nr:DNA repair protein RecN [Ardenticatenaceae bacterium]